MTRLLRVAAAALCFPLAAAEIHGTVLSAIDRKPLNRAEVILRSSNPGATGIGATTDEQGRFTFLDVADGSYVLRISRTGYVPTTTIYQHDARLHPPFEVEGDLTGLVARLAPAATISGKARFTDGEPAAGFPVQAYREFFQRKRHVFEPAGRAVSDDRGQYRIYGLVPGRYYVAALVAPFGGSEDVREGLVRDSFGQLLPPERTVTTFLPSSWKLSEATQLVAKHGSEIDSADILLARSRTATVSGRILRGDGLATEGASLVLFREDAGGSGGLPYPTVVRILTGGEYEARGVTPGSYILEGRASTAKGVLLGRQPLTVGNAPEAKADVLLQPDFELSGVVVTAEREGKIPPELRIGAESRSTGSLRQASMEPDGSFKLRLMPGETYDLILNNPPGNVYLKSARIDAADLLSGLRLDGAGATPLTLTIDEHGAEIHGAAPPGATVALVPEDRVLARYIETAANEWGVFGFRAVAPGDYRLLAWFDEPPCEIWNPVAEGDCARFGQPLRAQEGGTHTIQYVAAERGP